MSFAVFVALVMTNSPNYRKNIKTVMAETLKSEAIFGASHKEWFESSVKKFEEATGEKDDMLVEEFRKFVQSGEYELEVTTPVVITMIARQIKLLSILFYKIHWSILKSSGDFKFITGDNPLFYFDPTVDQNSIYGGVGLLNGNIEVTLPLSSEVAAFGTWKSGGGYIQLKNDDVRRMNRRTTSSALRFVFASEKSEKIRKFVVKYKKSAPVIEVL